MFEILTLPEWQIPMPAEYCARDESYWTCVELPICGGSVFIINVDPDPERQLPCRKLAVASGTALLSAIARFGISHIRSGYWLCPKKDGFLADPIAHITVGIDPADRWRSAYLVAMRSGATVCGPSDEAASRMIRRYQYSFED